MNFAMNAVICLPIGKLGFYLMYHDIKNKTSNVLKNQ